MIYLALFLGFLKVGCFSFGGAYGAIPLIREVVLQNHWMDEAYFSHIVAVAESTPGPIMVNVATYVGNTQGHLLGAIISTIAVVLPSFILILLIMSVLKNMLKNPYFQSFLKGMKPCIIGIILATGIYMFINNIQSNYKINLNAAIITLLLGSFLLIYHKIKKKKPSPISVIIVSAIIGMMINII